MLIAGDDSNRKWEVLKQFASGPFKNHSIGNKNTLSGRDIVQQLKRFYEKEYSANRMAVVLIS